MTAFRPAHVVIIGAGPAGAATALALLRSGIRATVVDRSTFDEHRVGEHLSPDAWPSLAELGLIDAVRAGPNRACAGIRSTWGSDRPAVRDYIESAYGLGLNLSRSWFDRHLCDEISRRGGAVLLGAKIRELTRDGHVWRLAVRHGTGNCTPRADFLVDASGRSAWLGRRLGRRRLMHDRLVGLIAVLDPVGSGCRDEAMLEVEAIEEGWWYSVALKDGRLVATFMTDADLLASSGRRLETAWSYWLSRAPQTGKRCARYERASDVMVRSARSQRLDQPTGSNWLAVGDAALSLDPLSSSGISKGFSSGIMAAETILACLDGNTDALSRYARAIHRDYEEYLLTRSAYYRLENRWPDAPFWQRRRALPLDGHAVKLHPQDMLATVEAGGSPAAQ